MTIEQAIADQTAAVKEGNALLAKLLAAFQSGAPAVQTKGPDSAVNKTGSGATSEPIYWHVPGTEEFGSVESETEWKKVKKEKPKAVKIPESKYSDLVDAASNSNTGDAEYSERIQSLIDAVPDSPDEGDIVSVFQKYLSKDLDKSERDARAEIIKPILSKVKAAKATAVKEDDRRDVMIEVIKGVELHLEETGQVSDEDGLV